MRLRELQIENFGVHQNRRFTFAPGLQAIYGPNEAGKSTLLRLFRDLLFGFHDRSPYAWLNRSQPLAATLRFQLADGREGWFRRQKGRPDHLTGELAGGPLDAALLTKLLNDTSRPLYERIFAFDQSDLAQDVQALKDAGLQEALFGGGIGGLTRFRAIEQRIAERMKELFNEQARAHKQPINLTLHQLRETQSSYQKSRVRPQQYDDLLQQQQERRDHEALYREQIDRVRQEQARLHSLRKARPVWIELAAAEQERSTLNLPAGVSAEAIQEFRRLSDRRQALQAELDELRSAAASAERLPEPTSAELRLIEAEAALLRLQRELSHLQDLTARLDRWRREAAALQTELAGAPALGAKPVGAAHREQARQLEERGQQLAEQETRLQTSRDGLNARRSRWQSVAAASSAASPAPGGDAARAASPGFSNGAGSAAFSDGSAMADPGSAALGSAASVARASLQPATRCSVQDWEAFLEEARSWQEDHRRLQEQEAALRATSQRGEALLAQLQGPIGTELRAPATLPTPLRATVREHGQRLAKATATRQRVSDRGDDAHETARQAREALADWDRTGPGDERARLLRLRDDRDAGWRLIRRRWLASPPADDAARVDAALLDWVRPVSPRGMTTSGTATPAAENSSSPDRSSTADAAPAGEPLSAAEIAARFEAALLEADLQSDRAQANAEWQAQRRRREEAAEAAEERLTDLLEQLSAADRAVADVEQEWRRLWSDCGFAPLSPDAMLEWLDALDAYRDLEAGRQRHEAERAALALRVAAFESKLERTLPDCPSAPAAAVRAVEQRCREFRRQDDERRRLAEELCAWEAESEQLAADERRSAAQRGEWRQQVQRLLAELELPADWSIASAQRALEERETMRLRQRQLGEVQEQLGAAESTLEEFAGRVAALTAVAAVDLAGQPPLAAADELCRRFDAARAAQHRRDRLAAAARQNEQLTAVKQSLSAEVDSRLQAIAREAGAASLKELDATMARAERALLLAAVIEERKRSLRSVLGDDWESHVEELQELTDERAEVRDQKLRDDLEVNEQGLTREATARGAIEQELQARCQDTRSLELGRELEELRGRLVGEVDRWAPLAITQALMQRALRRFEQEQQPRLLRDVGDLLARMTHGEHTSLRRRLNGDDELVVIGRGGVEKLPKALSTGTREQLYLAIRLAFVADYCRHCEPLPVVMDDVLVNWDEGRARATLEVLAECARDTQVLLLTCHQRTVELWRSLQPDAAVIELPTVSELGGWGQQTGDGGPGDGASAAPEVGPASRRAARGEREELGESAEMQALTAEAAGVQGPRRRRARRPAKSKAVGEDPQLFPSGEQD